MGLMGFWGLVGFWVAVMVVILCIIELGSLYRNLFKKALDLFFDSNTTS